MTKSYIVVNVESVDDFNYEILGTKEEADDICYLCNTLCNTKSYMVHSYDQNTGEIHLLEE